MFPCFHCCGRVRDNRKMSTNQDKIIIYCDGACSNNQSSINKGGWGAVLRYKNNLKEICGGKRNTTNQQMEIMACIRALEAIKTKNIGIEVFSDSAYLVNCINQKWYKKWEQNGWTNSKREAVANQDLWLRLLDLINTFQSGIKFIKVKGHAGIKLNEIADNLARKGITELANDGYKKTKGW